MQTQWIQLQDHMLEERRPKKPFALQEFDKGTSFNKPVIDHMTVSDRALGMHADAVDPGPHD